MERKIPKKNYLILTIILLVTIGLTLYFYLWYQTYEKNRLNTPIMNEHIFEINNNEIDNYIAENRNIAIYVSVVGNEEIRKFEKNFITLLNQYNLKNKLLYFDITKLSKSKLKSQYQINDLSIIDVPNILIFKDGKLSDIYPINIKDYNINKIENYLKVYNVIEVK